MLRSRRNKRDVFVPFSGFFDRFFGKKNDEDVKSIGETFKDLRKNGKIAFIPFVVAGDPDLRTTLKALKILGTRGMMKLYVLILYLFVLVCAERVCALINSFIDSLYYYVF